jgi:hypothetical protein
MALKINGTAMFGQDKIEGALIAMVARSARIWRQSKIVR